MSLLGARIHELRGPLSLYEVGKGSGVATADLSRYEQGKYLPTSMNLKKLANYFEVSYEELRYLYYEDFFNDPEERQVILKWAHQEKYNTEERKIMLIVKQLTPHSRKALVKLLINMLKTTQKSF